jgi:hypothetical protein
MRTTPPLDTGFAWPRLLAVTVPRDCYKGATSHVAAGYAFSTASVLLITSLFVDQRGQFETTPLLERCEFDSQQDRPFFRLEFRSVFIQIERWRWGSPATAPVTTGR